MLLNSQLGFNKKEYCLINLANYQSNQNLVIRLPANVRQASLRSLSESDLKF